MKKFFTIIVYFFLFTTNVYAEVVVNSDEIESEVFSTLTTDSVNHFIDDINNYITET